jgi:hypothetical protein
LDWDRGGRAERVDVIDPATGAVLDSRTVSAFAGGQYLSWTVTGRVTLRLTATAGPNAVLSGLFFGTGAAAGAAASFAGSNATTQGSWVGAFGADGYQVVGAAAALPAYAQVTPSGNSSYTWAASTQDTRALQKPGATDRIAATWYAATSFTVDVNLADGQSHRVSLYLVDWDGQGRAERVDVVDPATGAVLDSRTISNFAGGQYLSWTVTGRVTLRVTATAGPNAVLSGIFFG